MDFWKLQEDFQRHPPKYEFNSNSTIMILVSSFLLTNDELASFLVGHFRHLGSLLQKGCCLFSAVWSEQTCLRAKLNILLKWGDNNNSHWCKSVVALINRGYFQDVWSQDALQKMTFTLDTFYILTVPLNKTFRTLERYHCQTVSPGRSGRL